MACQEHRDLANTIKEAHVKLRKAAREKGGDEAWILHKKNEDELKEYASAMHTLATQYWDKNDKNVSRIQWVVQLSREYFQNDGHISAKQKEENLHRVYFNKELEVVTDGASGQLCLLDVGSCYNPFKNFDIFNSVTAIDLIPATEDVLKCDFLNLDVVFGCPSSVVPTKSPCTVLPGGYFNIVVFSLLLEYSPCKKQRWICCVKAYQLLKPNGLLVIITPDSKHASANARLIKSWRLALASLGFLLLKCEKHQHLNCLAYRKCFNPEVAAHWLSLQKTEDFVPEDMICIPQDFNEYNEQDNDDVGLVMFDRDSIVDDFTELPCMDFEI